MNTRPPAVTIGPPRLGEPHSGGTAAAAPRQTAGDRSERHVPRTAAGPQIDRDQRCRTAAACTAARDGASSRRRRMMYGVPRMKLYS